MSEEWVPFQERLAKGAKRSIPRGVRFVLLELSLEARSKAGVILLPVEWTTERAVHDLLGGNRREINQALKVFTKPDGDGVAPLQIVRDSTAHRLVVTKWALWAGPKSSTARVQDHRARKKNEQLAPDETLHGVAPCNGETPYTTGQDTTEHKQQQQQQSATVRAAAPAAAAAHPKSAALRAGSPDSLAAIEAEIRRHRVFDVLDARAIAEAEDGRLMTVRQKVGWVLAAIEECAAKSVGLGLQAPALQARLVGFMRHAKAPKPTDAEQQTLLAARSDTLPAPPKWSDEFAPPTHVRQAGGKP